MKKIVFMGVMLFTSFLLLAQEAEKGVRFMDNEPWENVLKKAREQNRWVFVDCYTTWCGPCKILATEILTQEKLGQFINEHCISVKYDVEKGTGLDFARKHRDYIHAFPTMLLIRPDDSVMQCMVGAFPAENILHAVQSGLDGITWKTLEKKYRAGNREFPFIKNYLNLLAISGEDAQCQAVAKDYLKRIPTDSLLNKEIWDMVEVYIQSPESQEFRFILQNLHLFAARGFNRYDLEWKLAINTYYRINDIIKTGFKTENRDTIAHLRKELTFLDTLLRNPVKDFPKYLAYVRTEMSYLNRDTEELLNRLIYLGENNLFENQEWEKAWAEYLIDHLADKKQIRRCVEYLYRIQKNREVNNNWIVLNCYDVLAKGYKRLKDKPQMEECLRASERLNKRNQEIMKDFNF